MSLLTGRKAYLPLEENVAYKAVMQELIEYPAEAPTPDNLGFIAFKFQLEDGRIITHTARVPVGTDILSQQLLAQLNNPNLNAMDQATLFDQCIKEKYTFKMWVERRDVDAQTYTNYHFRQHTPRQSALSQTAQTDTPLPFK